MDFTEGKYRLRNGHIVNITYRHHGWGLSSQDKIPGLTSQWHTWVIMEQTGQYRGDRAVLQVWDSKEDPPREAYNGKPLSQPRSMFDILEKL